MDRPLVMLQNEVSVDGRMDWLDADLGRFYQLASRWEEDATLVGSGVVLEMERDLEEDPSQEGEAPDDAPLLVITDSRGQVSRWEHLTRLPYWRYIIVLCSAATPEAYKGRLAEQGIEYIVAGEEQVDFPTALAELRLRYGVSRLRVDSGGTLSGVLLRADLVDEVRVLIEPRLVGGSSMNSMFQAPDLTNREEVIHLKLVGTESFDDDAVWLRYRVIR